MARRIGLLSFASTLLLATTAAAGNGLYFGFNLGYANTDGNRGILLKSPDADPDSIKNNNASHTEIVRTDAGSGFAGDFRLGYNIFGLVAIELDMGGSFENLTDADHFGTNFGVFGLVRFYPAELIKAVSDRFWDPYIFIGGGVHAVVYKPDVEDLQNKARAWFPSGAIKYGLGCDFYPVPFLSLGIDLGFTNGFHDTYVVDYDKPTKTEADSEAHSFAFQASLSILFHFDFSGD